MTAEMKWKLQTRKKLLTRVYPFLTFAPWYISPRKEKVSHLSSPINVVLVKRQQFNSSVTLSNIEWVEWGNGHLFGDGFHFFVRVTGKNVFFVMCLNPFCPTVVDSYSFSITSYSYR